MTAQDTQSERDGGSRTGQRYSYEHHLDITFEGKEWPAGILDWSNKGIQVIVDAPISEKIEYEAEFHIHRTSFVSDEEFEDENNVPPVEEWARNGTVRWIKKQEDRVVVGISFHEKLEGLPLPDLPEYITEADLCLLKIFPKGQR